MSDLHEWLARRFIVTGCLKNADADAEATKIVRHIRGQLEPVRCALTECLNALDESPAAPRKFRDASMCHQIHTELRQALEKLEKL
jgi:hypothetical protein